MNALLIGGAGPHNKEWIVGLGKTFAPLFDRVTVHLHKHWQTGGEVDIEHELATLQQEVQELGTYIIFAKSIGTILALQGMRTGVLKPEGCVFVGLPVRLAQDKDIEFLQSNKTPILLAQNSSDPVGSFAETKALLQTMPAALQLVELPGDTHNYDDVEALKDLLAQLLSKQSG